jgi:tyrosyl-tRNA synthetase
MKNVVDILSERGLLEDVTSPDLRGVAESPLTVYAGFDPTSESLQAGNLVTVMVLAHFQRCGHTVIAVVGGGTGMIGDPSGKSRERNLLDAATVERNAAGIRENLSRFLDFEHETAPAKIVNNMEWLEAFTFIEFLRDVGKHFRMGTMLGKESVRARLDSEEGMSYAEFSYQLLQAYDFLVLHDREQCVLQVGGSDQWGNITAGIELIRRLRGTESYGLTMPLVCDSSGQKFGKSEGNAIYLDAAKTSVYDFYQFFVRTEDRDVIRFLKTFTFVPLDEVGELEKGVREAPERREAQQRLAAEVTRSVHGEDGLAKALRASAVMFGDPMDGLHADELLQVLGDVPSTALRRDEVVGARVADVAAATGLCSSKGGARRLIASGGLYLNNRRVAAGDAVVQAAEIVDGRLVVLRSGKKNFHVVRIAE